MPLPNQPFAAGANVGFYQAGKSGHARDNHTVAKADFRLTSKDKPAERRDKVLMIDARNIYRKVTRKIYDFTPEQYAALIRADAEKWGKLIRDANIKGD